MEGSRRADLLAARRPDGRRARVVDEMRRIHERDALGRGGLGHAQDGSMVDERFIDQDMLARRDRRECDLFLRDRGGGDVDGVDVGAGQQAVDSLNRRDPWRLATKLCAFSIRRLDTAVSLAFAALAIASATTPAIMPVPTMPNPSWDDFISALPGRGMMREWAAPVSLRPTGESDKPILAVTRSRSPNGPDPISTRHQVPIFPDS